jgi:hypothetical protein
MVIRDNIHKENICDDWKEKWKGLRETAEWVNAW